MPLKYYETFASELAENYIAGKREFVRKKLRNLKSKTHCAFFSALVAVNLTAYGADRAAEFVEYMNPNNG